MFTNKITTLIILSMAIPSLFACSGEQNLLSTPEIQTQRIETPTPTLIPTATNTATIQVTSTPTTAQIPAATNTATIQVTTTPTLGEVTLFGKEVIAMFELGAGNLFLIDLKTGYSRQLNQNGDEFYGLNFSWINNGCEIVVYSKKLGIVGINLDGTVNREFIVGEQPISEYWYITSLSLSPTGLWLAFVDDSSSGLEVPPGSMYEGFGPSTGILNVIQVDGPEGKIRISGNNGVSEIVWSPDGSLLAYNDIDSRGIHQLFISSPNGSEQTQLTKFSEKYTLIEYISWSPDGKSIAFKHENMETYLEELVVVPLSGKPKIIDVSDHVTYTYSVLWLNNNLVFNYGLFDDESNKQSFYNAFWVDVESGNVVNTMFPDHSIDSFHWPAPIGSPNRLGFFGSNGSNHGFYICDFKTKSITIYENADDDIFYHSYYGPPEGFQGEASCLP